MLLLRHLPGQRNDRQLHELSSSLLSSVSAAAVAGSARTCGGCRAARAVLEGVGRFACRAPIDPQVESAAAQGGAWRLSRTTEN